MTGIERLRDIAEDRYSGGMVHISVYKLREICEQIEAEAGVETVKREAMEAMAFVKEHGGLDKVRRELERAETWHLDKLEMYRLCTEFGGVEELKRRLMPGGCRPLLGIDGSPIVPGEVYYGQSDGKRWRIDAVGTLFAWAGLSKTARMRGEGPKRLRPEWLSREPPAPKVLDADGVEIRVGDEVWDSSTGDALIVRAINDDGKTIACRYVDVDGNAVPVHGMWSPTWLTHRAPVLAADGKPLREGETVYTTSAGRECIVHHIEDAEAVRLDVVGSGTSAYVRMPASMLTHQRPVLDADGVPIKVGDTVYFTDGREQEWNTVVHAEYDYKDEPYVQLGRLNEAGYPKYTNCSCIDPSQLTHTKPDPDTWERIEHDALVIDEMIESEWGGDPTDARDLVRRCKALAERDR